MKRVKLYILLFCLLITMILATGCGKAQKVTFVLDWTPNTNHTGVYVAVEKGYYAEEGLDVTIIQPSDMGADAMVASGAAQFGVSYQESVTFARAENVPLVSIAAVIQHNSSGFGALKEKNIRSPKDFEGKKYGGWGSPVEEATIKYLMEKAGADPSKVEILSVGTADFFQASSSGQIDFAWIFEGWDGVAAKLKGIEIDYIDLGKTDPVFDYYTPVIVTSEDMIQNNGKMVEAFMRATIKGYLYAIEHPEEAAEIFIKAVPEADPELIRESQKFLADRYQDDAPYWGIQKKEVWQRYNDWLYENGFISEPIDVEKAFTNKFVE
ncbi:ABC transporter substrate-binding protein [Thermoclostridium caenicola]|uniref:ABC-type nitrate/sulfonate/bicarbonate transport system, substrate-binding protein n=1 Tax=Thermoclostridium caenicola TaxID=659425 RepID=A0A1M6JUD8_9FIRM|nr:ABC transporter substrate-binding protein [Thermoclostridium caenicola]SHJ50301.1 ABC-type nitrate/sulfonate/bicarbonate transport system, substrate-binding protein [Thermoclostridium caenicola]